MLFIKIPARIYFFRQKSISYPKMDENLGFGSERVKQKVFSHFLQIGVSDSHNCHFYAKEKFYVDILNFDWLEKA